MLLGHMEISFSNFCGEQKTVMFQAFRFSQLLKPLRAEHLSERIRGVYGAIYEDMSHVNAF